MNWFEKNKVQVKIKLQHLHSVWTQLPGGYEA